MMVRGGSQGDGERGESGMVSVSSAAELPVPADGSPRQ